MPEQTPNTSTQPPAPAITGSRSLAALRRLLVGVFAVLLALPLMQQVTGHPRDARLHGAEKPVARPAFTWRAWFDGKFAGEFETWYVAHAGLRGLLVRVGNQARYSLFRQTPKSAGTPVIVGRDHWLYEAEYVRHYTRRRGMPPATAAEFAHTLRALQDALADRGIWFTLVISPSKPEIYPEFLPADVRPLDSRTPNAYETLRPLLDRESVRVVDAHALFKAWRAAGPEAPPLFPSGGTHWNYYGGFRCVAELLNRARADKGLAVAAPRLKGVVYARPAGTDTDLLALLNLFSFQRGGPPDSPYPVIDVEPLPAAVRPDVLVVGDSFAFTLIDALHHARAVRTADLLYYFKRRYAYDLLQPADRWPLPHDRCDRGPIEPAALDWPALLLSKKAVILEINEILLPSYGWGFPEAALTALRQAPPVSVPKP